MINNIHVADIGNGYTNVITPGGKYIEFPSLVRDVRDRKTFTVNEQPFKTSFGQFLTGRDCLGEENVARHVDSSFYSSNDARVLFLKSMKYCEVESPIIVVGLPSSLWQEHKTKFESNILAWSRAEGYSPQEVIVLPQHAGPFYDPDLVGPAGERPNREELFGGPVLIFDIGRGTIDCGVFDQGQPKQVRNGYSGEPEGIYQVYSHVITSLKTGKHPFFARGKKKMSEDDVPKDYKVHADIDIEMLDQWVRDGHYSFRGKDYPVYPLIEQSCRYYADTHIQKCLSQLPDIDYMKAVIIAGGGSMVLRRPLLSEYFSCPIYIPDNSGFSVARGFREYTRLCIENAQVQTA